MRRKLFIAALIAGAAGTGYLLGQVRDEAARTRSESVHQPVVELPGKAAPREAPDAPPAPPTSKPEAAPAPSLPTPAPGALVGVVRLNDGNPLVDADVVVTLEGDEPETFELRPDANGQVRLERLQPGRYRLRATHEGYAPREFGFDVDVGGGAGPFDIVFVEGGTLAVRVVGAGAAPLPACGVTVQGQGAREVLGTETDVRGEAIFEHLAAGQYFVRCGGEGGQTKAVTVEPGRRTALAFELSCRFASTALDPDGRPLAGAIVRLLPVDSGEGYQNVKAETDEFGRFEMRGFAPGEYRPTIQVLRPVAYVSSLEPIRFAPGQARDDPLRIPGTSLSGSVTRADTGDGIENATILAYRVEEAEDGGRPRRVGEQHRGWADERGRYRLTGLTPGRYELWAFPIDKSLAHEMRYVDFTKGGALDAVDFALGPRALGTVRLRIREPDGTPATGLNFFVKLEGGVTLTLHEKEVGDGVFDLKVEAGTREIGAYRKGVRTVRFVVDVAEGETLEREAKLVVARPG